MKKLLQFVLSMTLVLTLSFIASARQRLPDNAQAIVTGQNTLLLNQLATHVGGENQLEALIGVDDDLLEEGELSLEEVFQRAVEAKLITASEAEEILIIDSINRNK